MLTPSIALPNPSALARVCTCSRWRTQPARPTGPRQAATGPAMPACASWAAITPLIAATAGAVALASLIAPWRMAESAGPRTSAMANAWPVAAASSGSRRAAMPAAPSVMALVWSNAPCGSIRSSSRRYKV